jgi:hypothetical protein
MADILRSRESLTARIAFAPPETIHAIAAFLHLAPEAAGSDTEVGDFIEQRDSRELLKRALPDCPRGYTALDRAGSFALPHWPRTQVKRSGMATHQAGVVIT